mmetsp:Transcript_13004/g.19480  ORF Transcript_13004/g.19480 Transcript_13004/m.19480 type:complete len:211 (+) Transcript_13004:54-686(+)
MNRLGRYLLYFSLLADVHGSIGVQVPFASNFAAKFGVQDASAPKASRLRSMRMNAELSERGFLTFRQGVQSDLPLIASRLLSEKMNPIIPSTSNFVVATLQNETVAFGQLRPLGDTSWELASLYVEKKNRGKRIGSALLDRLVQRHKEINQDADLYLLTLNRTSKFYEKSGFSRVDVSKVPAPMRAEFAAGKYVASFFAKDDLVTMKLFL